MRGHLALRQEGSPPSCTFCLSSITGKPKSPDGTARLWTVDDIEAEVADLKVRGVVFEEYDTREVKTVTSVATLGQSKGAWFKDSEGNLLALGQFD